MHQEGKMAKTAYISDGPSLDGAVKVSGNGPGQVRSSQTASPLGAGTGSSALGQSQLEEATIGSMPVVNTLTVETNKDGTIGIKASVADAMPETDPGASSRNGSASANTGSVSSVGVQTGWVFGVGSIQWSWPSRTKGIKVLTVPPTGGIGIAGTYHELEIKNFKTHHMVTNIGDNEFTKADIQLVYLKNRFNRMQYLNCKV